MGFLAGKRLLITGVLNNRSIAYGVARACHREGAELAFSYQGERFKERITEYAAEFGSKLVFDCDVGSDEQIVALIAGINAEFISREAEEYLRSGWIDGVGHVDACEPGGLTQIIFVLVDDEMEQW